MKALSVLFLASFLGAQVAGAGPDAAPQRPTGDSRAGGMVAPLPGAPGPSSATRLPVVQTSTQSGLEAIPQGPDPIPRPSASTTYLSSAAPADAVSSDAVSTDAVSSDTFSRLLDELFEDYLESEPQALDAGDAPFPDLNDLDLTSFELPVVINKEVERWLLFFAVKERESFEQWLAASTRYLPLMLEELQRAGLPRELAYVAMIESGFDPNAGSPMGARGIWQFMTITARAEGLRVGALVDERRDPIKSTRAAVRHLETLYRKYGDWYISLAAYNAGIGTVARATGRGRNQDFWQLARRGAFKRETAQYVPRLLAASIIASAPERFGFYEVPYEEPMRFATVEVHAPVALPLLAARLGINPEALFTLNPELLRGETPPGSWSLRIPPETLALYEATAQADASRSWMVFRQHRVRSGDTLARLARSYGVPISELKRRNGLKKDVLKPGQVLLVPIEEPRQDQAVVKAVLENGRGEDTQAPLPVAALALQDATSMAALALDAGQSLTLESPQRPAARVWRVRRGDTLSSIAKNFGISAAELQRQNGLVSQRVRPGQELVVPLPQGLKVDGVRPPHKVEAGDTLSSIARRYTVRLEDLRRVNGLRPGDTLAVGQRLSLPAR